MTSYEEILTSANSDEEIENFIKTKKIVHTSYPYIDFAETVPVDEFEMNGKIYYIEY